MSNFKSIVTKSVQLNGQELIFEVGRFAEQASGAVLVRYGDTVVHVTVVEGGDRSDLGYFPLFVEYQEKLYAGGIIKGSRWVKREGRPTDEAVLKARLIDRSIRPLFPQGYLKEVQVVATVLSVDNQNDPDIPALCGASAALAISSLPWQGPIAAVRLGLDKAGQYIINPTYDQLETSQLDLILSGSDQAVVMVEAGAQEVSETDVVKALKQGHQQVKKIIDTINQLVAEVGVKKQTIEEPKITVAVKKQVLAKTKSAIDDLIARLKTGASAKELQTIEAACIEDLSDQSAVDIKTAIYQYFKDSLRQQLFSQKIRPDNRKIDEIRPLSAQTGILPRTHGSAIFKRGSTQALTITTLGAPNLEQLIESMEGQETKRYIHHYFFPPYSVGETGRMGWPSRREVGHGALAERALLPVIPDEDAFPYTIRVVSEIMSSNGSTSMAAVCGSSLSLMDAGVPIKKPVAGIAMGLVADLDNQQKIKDYLVLTDIQGLEDHLGDMDFKVAGTATGITALQMDIKISGVTFEILATALEQAKTARLAILDVINKALPAPRPQVSPFAPKIAVLNIPADKIGEVIGPGGRVIRQIIKTTDCQVDVNDEGRVVITGADKEKVNQALNWIDGLTREIKAGEEFDGKVVRIEPYGAFVEILPGRDGMVHVSRLSLDFVANAHDVLKLGDTLHVRVREIDDQGRISLTALTPEQESQARQKQPAGRFDRSRSRRPNSRSPRRR
jgi:polyribonucleotide nucleotidyltransferase